MNVHLGHGLNGRAGRLTYMVEVTLDSAELWLVEHATPGTHPSGTVVIHAGSGARADSLVALLRDAADELERDLAAAHEARVAALPRVGGVRDVTPAEAGVVIERERAWAAADGDDGGVDLVFTFDGDGAEGTS